MTALITALLLAQGLQPTSYVGYEAFTPFGPGGSSLVLNLPFSTPGCYASGVGGVSITRATPATYESAPGVFTSCAAGSYRVEAKGLLVEGQRINNIFWSGAIVSGTTLGTSWLALGTPTYATAGAAPHPEATWARITTTANTDPVYQSRIVASTTSVTASVWAKADTGTDTVSVQAGCASGTNTACTCGRSDGGSTTARPGVTAAYHCTCDANGITTTPVRIWATATCGTATTTATFAVTPGAYMTSTGTADFAMAQLEGGLYPTSYIPTTTAGVTRNADQITVPTPAGLPLDGLCVTSTFSTDSSIFEGVGPREVWSFGGTRAVANWIGLERWSDARLYALAFGSDTQGRWKFITSLAAGSHASKVSWTPGAISSTIDGVEMASSAGTGTLGQSVIPTPIHLGSLAGVYSLDGYLKNFRLYRSASCR